MTSRIFTDDDGIGGAAAIAGAGLAIGLGLIALSRQRAPSWRSRTGIGAPDEALVAYLREHLSASDAALAVVEKLWHSAAEGDVRQLAETLRREFDEERDSVRVLLASTGASPYSAKRAAGGVVGRLLGPMAGGRVGELSLLRTLEGLAVGVQGKRCLWRALASAFPTHPGPAGRSFAELEAMAVRQWEAIEQQRQALARATFRPEYSFRRADRRQAPFSS
jgi:hypothetical protein